MIGKTGSHHEKLKTSDGAYSCIEFRQKQDQSAFQLHGHPDLGFLKVKFQSSGSSEGTDCLCECIGKCIAVRITLHE